MKSESITRFAALALSLFLSSNDVESFQVSPSSTWSASRSSSFVGSSTRSGSSFSFSSSSSSSTLAHPQHSYRSRSIPLHMAANPKTDDTARMAYNDTAKTALTDSTSLASPSALDSAERAWALEDASESDSSSQALGFPQKYMTADTLGPLLSVVLTTVFLCYTLLSAGGVSDAYETMNLQAKLDVLGGISWLPNGLEDAKLVVGLVMAFSSFAQALTGFGFAVVAVGAMSSMPWLLHSELYDVITPVAATLGALVGFILLIPYAFAAGPPTEEEPGLDWGEILPLLIPCTLLTPVGIQLNSMVDPVLATRILAGLIMGFVAYKLVPTIQDAMGNSTSNEIEADEALVIDVTNGDSTVLAGTAIPEDQEEESFLQSRTAAILFGSAAGIFGGAFDVQGPPLCVYGDAKGWSPAKFRNNVLAVVCLNSAFVVAIDFFKGDLGDFYYSYFCLTSLPGVLLGVVAGQYASKRIDPVLFKNLVLVMCLGLGIQLLRVS